MYLCFNVQLLQRLQEVCKHCLPSRTPFQLEQRWQAAGRRHPPHRTAQHQQLRSDHAVCRCMRNCGTLHAAVRSGAGKQNEMRHAVSMLALSAPTFQLLAAAGLHGRQSGTDCIAPLHSSAHPPVEEECATQPYSACKSCRKDEVPWQ